MSGKQTSLSESQQSIWHLHQLASKSSAFNIGCSFKLSQPIGMQSVKTAIERLVEHHGVLRTTYNLNENGVYKIIHESVFIDFKSIDGLIWSQTELQANFNSVLSEPIDIKNGPVVRFRLYSIDSGTCSTVLICAHNIALDHCSLSFLQSELQSFIQNPVNHISSHDTSYENYIHEQKHYLNSSECENNFNILKNELESAPPLLDIPSDFVRSSVRDFKGNTHRISINGSLRDDIYLFAKKFNVQPYDILLAAFSVFLSKHAGQETIVIGLPIDERPLNSSYTNAIGVFSNQIPLKIVLNSDFTITNLIEHIVDQKNKGVKNIRYPFNQFVKNYGVTPDFSRSPVFQAFYDWQGCEDGCLTDQLNQEEGQFDISLVVYDFQTRFSIQLRYATQVFSEETIKNFANRFITILENLLKNPSVKISDLPLLSESELTKVTKEWNCTSTIAPQLNSVQEIIEKQSEKTPLAIAAIAGDVTFTYKDLDEKSNQIANFLRSRSIKRGMLVGIFIDRSMDMLVGLLGILKSGAAYVPLDPLFPSERISHIIEDSAVTMIITKKSLQPSLRFSGTYICLDEQCTELYSSPTSRPSHTNTQEDLSYVLYTSGSTGKPKGVEISHGAMINFLLSMIDVPGLNPKDIFCAITTISFDIAVLELFGPLCIGAKTVILDNETSKDATRLSGALLSHKATVMQATPATWEMLTASGWQGSKDLRVLCGGEALRQDLANSLLTCASEVWNMYGPTETTVWSSCRKLSKTDNVISNTLRRVAVSSFGFCGTNAHVILEEPPLQKAGNASRPRQLIVLSAKSKTSLDNITEKFQTFFKNNQIFALPDVAFTLQSGRNFLKHRKFIVCSDSAEASVMLNQPDPNRSGQRNLEKSSNKSDVTSFMLEKIRKIIEDISGVSLSEASFNSSFFDLGFDSLVLTQIARVISKETKTQITLRNLMENYASINVLTIHIVSTLSDDSIQALMSEQKPKPVKPAIETIKSVTTEKVAPTNSTLSENALEQVMIRQMDIIERLVALLESREKKNLIEFDNLNTHNNTGPIDRDSATTKELYKKNTMFMNLNNPPVPGARLGRYENGNPAWYIPDQSQSGKFIKLGN
jgi:non-ribosomal peptide synthetase component F/acyl carrier protein